MPSVIKRKTSDVEKSPFQVYAGDDPKPGGYRAVLKFVNAVKSSGDNVMLKPVLELKAAPGSEKAKFDGYPVFPQIVLTDNESNKQREQSFYLAVCGKTDVDISCDVDPGKFKPSDGQKAKVLKIGNVKPENIVVNVKLRMKPAQGDYPAALECDLVFASRDQQDGAASSDEEDAEDDEEVAEYTEDELLALGLVALRAILVDEFGMDAAEAKLLKQKAKLVEAILNAQQDDEEDEDDESDSEEDDEEEDEDDEEEDDEEDDAEAAAREEAAGMDRTQLKTAIKKRQADFKFLKSQSDEDLVEALVKLILTDPPF